MTDNDDNKIVESTENLPTNNQANETKPEETQEQINWKKFREKRAEERREMDRLRAEKEKKEQEAEALKAALESVVSKPNTSPYYANGEVQEETEEQKIERLVNDKFTKREQKELEEKRIREQQELPVTLKKVYNDFDNICNQDNLDYLDYHYPEVSKAFQAMPDSFDKWSNIYKAVKRFVPNPQSEKDQKRAERNFNKPQSMNVAGTTQTTDGVPHYLDDKKKADNWKNMQRRMKGLA